MLEHTIATLSRLSRARSAVGSRERRLGGIGERFTRVVRRFPSVVRNAATETFGVFTPF
jgi:hypothetical protein